MKVTTEELERCEVLLTVEVEPAKEQDMLKKAARRIAREVQIPGFRRGKAPYNTVVRRFGLEAVQQEALEAAGEKLIDGALKEADLQPTAQISFESIDWNPLTLKLKVPGPPKIELGDYRDLRLDFETIEVSEEEITADLEALQEQNATWVPVERPTQLNDLIDMAVVERDGDEILAEHESIEYELTLPEDEEDYDEEDEADVDEIEDDVDEDEAAFDDEEPDLTTPLLGLSAGEEKTFSIDYPDDYHNDDYAGSTITFEVKVNSVKQQELDPLDDDFAQMVSEFDTLDELKARIETNIRERRKSERNQKLGEELLDQIIANAEQIDWPVALEEEMIDEELRRLEGQLQQSNLKLENYLRIEGKTEEEFREEFRDKAVEGLKRSIVIGEIANLEKILISQSEILDRAKMIADLFGGGSDQIWRSIISSQSQQSRLANDILVTKVIDRLAAIARGEAPEPGAEEDEEAETDSDEAATEETAAADVAADTAPTDNDESAETENDEAAEDDDPEAESTDEETPVATKA